ncbi:MAG: ClpXP protease specificity-enhancing factor [Burkholderiaceae bacterium]|nr:ClpXP protease specificity-enhancing factor [Burkholderiaceae bacterium]
MSESSTKPYFIRALHEWCTDNGYTPHIVVHVDENTLVPRGYISDGQITLNLGLLATNQLDLNNEFISFQARFGGKTEDIWVPVKAVSAIFARETGAGMGFEVGEGDDISESSEDVADLEAAELNVEHNLTEGSTSHKANPTTQDEASKPKRPHLTIVK